MSGAFAGKVVLITGGARNLGRAMGYGLRRRRCVDRDQRAVAATGASRDNRGN